jgi:hypothetical protein
MLAGALLVLAFARPATVPASGDAHAGGECATCHGAHDEAPGDAAPESDPAGCALLATGSENATSNSCLACHPRHAFGGHPYDVEYPRPGVMAGARSLRPLDEVLRRGLVLPERQIRCVTCHDRSSPWKFHIKLPPGTQPTHAVDVRRRETLERPELLPPLRPGDDVGKKPLCVACHQLE